MLFLGWNSVVGLGGKHAFLPSQRPTFLRKVYLGRGGECSQTTLQFMSVLHELCIEVELVPLYQ